ncbi:MAG: efflux RND transporter periplasmic adaptor subunit [Pirellulales bacterium]
MSSVEGRRWSFVALGALLLIGSANVGCKKPPDAASAAAPPKVRYVLPQQAEVTDYEYFDGTMDAPDTVSVRAHVTGYLDEVYFKDGEEVEASEENPRKLFLIDPRTFEALYNQAKAQTQLALARLKIATADYDRGVAVSKTPGAISPQELETYAAQMAQAKASVTAAEAAEDLAKKNLGYTIVYTKVGGLLSRPYVTPGNLVVQDNTLLATVVPQDPIYCYFNIDSTTSARFQKLIRDGKIRSAREGNEMHLQVRRIGEPDEEYPHDGILDYIDNRVSTSTGTLELRARFANPKAPGTALRQFAAGEKVEVRVPVGPKHPALLVPQAAVGTDQSQKFIFVLSKDNKVEYRPVDVGEVQPGAMQEIIPRKVVRIADGVRLAEVGEQGEDSITPSDRIVVAGLQRIRNGLTVNPQEYVPPQPPAAVAAPTASPSGTAAN